VDINKDPKNEVNKPQFLDEDELSGARQLCTIFPRPEPVAEGTLHIVIRAPHVGECKLHSARAMLIFTNVHLSVCSSPLIAIRSLMALHAVRICCMSSGLGARS
jgi:hypothetical protein